MRDWKASLILASVMLATAALPRSAFAQPYDHLACYKIKDTHKFSAVADLIPLQAALPVASGCEIKIKGAEFCAPVEKNLQSSTAPSATVDAQELTNDFICYKVKCPKVDIGPISAGDQFGTRALAGFKARKLCVPAIQAAVTTTTMPPACGNDLVEAGEQCDGDVGSATCESQGFSGGTLACTACQYDTSGCAAYQVQFCRLQFPATASVSSGTPVQVYGRVYIPGITDQTTMTDSHASVTAQVCYGPDGSSPSAMQCAPASPNPSYDGVVAGEPNNDEYVGSITVGMPGAYDYAYRFSTSGGTPVDCDTGAGSSNGYSAADAGQLTVTPAPLPSCSNPGGSCGSCGDGTCMAHCPGPGCTGSSNVCVSISGQVGDCSTDADCPAGTICFGISCAAGACNNTDEFGPLPGACTTPCP